MWSRLTVVGIFVLGFTGSVAAADPLPRAEIDKRVVAIIYDAETLGVQLWKLEKYEDCMRVYQATLMTLYPILDHRPKLVTKIKDGLARTKEMSTADAAFAFRSLLDETSNACNGTTMPLWIRLAGGKPDSKLVNADLVNGLFIQEFVAAAKADPNVKFLRDGKNKFDPIRIGTFQKDLDHLLSTLTGGKKYNLSEMKKSYAGLKITDTEFDILSGHLIEVLKKYKVNPDNIDELMTIVRAGRKEILALGNPSLWDRLGGDSVVTAVAKDFLTAAAADKKVNLDRNGKYPLTPEQSARLTKLLVEFISSATGGPLKYTGPDVKKAFQEMNITEAEFNAASGDLIAGLKKHNVPPAAVDEFVGLVNRTRKDIVEKK
ncbi:MAG TPA: hypothetical protein VGJ05_12500 [Fimbriiglobus sp.]|jgi:hemoglobin